MEFSYSQTENFEIEKLSSDAGYFKKPVEINSMSASNLLPSLRLFWSVSFSSEKRNGHCPNGELALLLVQIIYSIKKSPVSSDSSIKCATS